MEDAARADGDSVDGTLELVSTQPFLLSLRTQSRPPAWLERQRLMRFQTGYLSVPLVPAFDAVAYFDRGAPAVRITGGR